MFATGVLVPAFATKYREEGTLPGEAGPDTTLVWPDALPLKLAAFLVLSVLFLRFWDRLQRDERAAR